MKTVYRKKVLALGTCLSAVLFCGNLSATGESSDYDYDSEGSVPLACMPRKMEGMDQIPENLQFQEEEIMQVPRSILSIKRKRDRNINLSKTPRLRASETQDIFIIKPSVSCDDIGSIIFDGPVVKRKRNPHIIATNPFQVNTDNEFELRQNESIEEYRGRKLLHNITVAVRKHFSDAFPAFVKLTIEGYKRGACNFEELANLALQNPKTFRYVTRSNRPARESVASYVYLTAAFHGENGFVNVVKRNIMDEVLLWISMESPNISTELIHFVERLINRLMNPVVDALKIAMIEELRSLDDLDIGSGCCGWCNTKKITKETKRRLVFALGQIFKGVLARVVGQDFANGASALVGGLVNAIEEMRGGNG